MFFCPRCDRPYVSPELMQEHLERHPDFDEELFGLSPREENDSGPAKPEGYREPGSGIQETN